ncbi:zinc-binding dehydrogenase [Nocardia sp. CA2R105]|uniref:zinc-dependent alcohol dehydrogenase family protein n=1 Tax=Nocardia coffeae TaxID=2873381 RepID=UPI001CA69490|nr:zinc-binding dehydrogenase [Nocardia coffeae]MBY8858695.1 zinc-binding dehydrogenase [Nocardia coffeae]
MQGLVFLGERRVELREFDQPEPGAGEVVLAIKASGLCGSDLHRYRGPAVREDEVGQLCVTGHEPAGVVAAVGPGVAPEVAAVGDRVMMHHYGGCGACDRCRSGWPQMCDRVFAKVYGTDTNGAHAPFMLAQVSTLVPLADALSFEAGAAIGCGTGTAWGGLARLQDDIGGATVAVFGQGPVGLSATMLARARGARVIAIDLSPERLEAARKFGATETLNPAEVDVAAAVRDLTDGVGTPFVLETSGSSSAATTALDSLAKWGKACMIGLGGTVSFAPQSYLRTQITVMTSWSMSIVHQAECARFIAQHGLPVDELFSHQWRLDQAEEAYAEFDRQTSSKAAFVFD